MTDQALEFEAVPCDSCGSEDAEQLFERESSHHSPEAYLPTTDSFLDYGRVVRCRKCGMVRASPRPKQDYLFTAYRNTSDEHYLEEEFSRLWSARSILRHVERVSGIGRLLDVGCGAGVLLSAAKGKWDASGVELSRQAGAEARRRTGLNIAGGTLEDAKFPPESFDALTMVDVIEHLPSPRSVIVEAGRILKPGGPLFILTPDISAPVARLMGRWWWGLRPAHLHYFSRRTLASLLSEHGFEVLYCWYFGRMFTFGYWISRLKGYAPGLTALAGRIAGFLRLARLPLYVNTFDSVGMLAVKRRAGPGGERRIVKGGKKVVAVLPAYNAEKTLERTLADIPAGLFDDMILVDDASRDGTVALARKLGLKVFIHPKNRGYGGNQKTCYREALASGADIVVMLHPDYQYDPKLGPDLVEPLASGRADCVLGSRLLKDQALKGKMPVWKYAGNKLLTGLENFGFGTKFSEYHTGYRAYSRELLSRLPLELNNDGFVFDQQIIAQMLVGGFRIAEVPIPTRYFKEASSVNFLTSVKYGLQTLGVILRYRLHRHGIRRFPQFDLSPPPAGD